MQELVSRLPILITLDDLVRILTVPDDSITKEYQILFKKDGIDLLYDDVLHEIVRLAFQNGTGAHGLRIILEDFPMDIIYEFPDMENISECIITKEALSTKVPILREAESTSDSVSEQGVF